MEGPYYPEEYSEYPLQPIRQEWRGGRISPNQHYHEDYYDYSDYPEYEKRPEYSPRPRRRKRVKVTNQEFFDENFIQTDLDIKRKRDRRVDVVGRRPSACLKRPKERNSGFEIKGIQDENWGHFERLKRMRRPLTTMAPTEVPENPRLNRKSGEYEFSGYDQNGLFRDGDGYVEAKNGVSEGREHPSRSNSRRKEEYRGYRGHPRYDDFMDRRPSQPHPERYREARMARNRHKDDYSSYQEPNFDRRFSAEIRASHENSVASIRKEHRDGLLEDTRGGFDSVDRNFEPENRDFYFEERDRNSKNLASRDHSRDRGASNDVSRDRQSPSTRSNSVKKRNFRSKESGSYRYESRFGTDDHRSLRAYNGPLMPIDLSPRHQNGDFESENKKITKKNFDKNQQKMIQKMHSHATEGNPRYDEGWRSARKGENEPRFFTNKNIDETAKENKRAGKGSEMSSISHNRSKFEIPSRYNMGLRMRRRRASGLPKTQILSNRGKKRSRTPTRKRGMPQEHHFLSFFGNFFENFFLQKFRFFEFF